MKNQISKTFTEVAEYIVTTVYSETVSIIKKSEKINKKGINKLRKKVNKRVGSIQNDIKFFDQYNENQLTTMFLLESLGILKELIVTPLFISYLEYLDVKELIKDKEFVIFLKNIILIDEIYDINKSEPDFDTESEYLKNLRIYFGDIRSIFLSYFIVKEQNKTINKIQNITSFVIKNSRIYGLSVLSQKQLDLFKQIHTGIKYEKIKQEIQNTNTTYTKKSKFNILNKVKNTIKIKYISKQDYKHRFHKSPVEHKREGHYRHYKSGKVVWIEQMTVNKEVA